MRIFPLISLAAALLLPFSAVYAGPEEDNTPDPSIAAKLKAKGTPYEVDEDGDYKIVVNVGDGRSQVVWVRSRVHSTDHHTIREIWTFGYRSKERSLPSPVANRLLSENFELIVGAWARDDGNAILVMKLDANADADTLDETIDLAASIGDEMEQKLTTGDDL